MKGMSAHNNEHSLIKEKIIKKIDKTIKKVYLVVVNIIHFALKKVKIKKRDKQRKIIL